MAPKRPRKGRIEASVKGGVVQGFVGTESVRIENLNFYGSPLPTQPSQNIDEGTIPPCPYPGLAYFEPQDSALFFGRATAIARLEAAVARHQLTALVGASGSGKSSLVLAGLAPRLHVQGCWRFGHFRVGTEPDKDPFLALARALVPLLGSGGFADQLEEVQKLALKLSSGAVNLSNAIGECRVAAPGKRILLIADQFEEIFTLVGDEVLRQHFIDALLAGFPDRADGKAPDVCLVLTLRADFYGMALRHRPLADALQGRVENLGPMTRDELREAIARPAGLVTFESGLVETLLDNVTSRPGSLPLLQFALREMWGRLDKPCMTRANYDAIGGVEGALAKHAQAIFEGLTEKGEDTRAVMLFRRLFTRLVTLGEGAEDTRRIVGRQELGPEAWQLAQGLAGENNRLVVTSALAPGHETAEVVHEALIRNWPTLIEWVHRDRAFQSCLRQLGPRLDEWRDHPQDEGALLRGGPLAVAEEWLGRRRDEISAAERAYIEASITLREVEKRRDEEAIAREHARLAEIAEVQEQNKEQQKRTAAALARTARLQRQARWTLAIIAAFVVAGVIAVLLEARRTERNQALVLTSLAHRALSEGQYDRAMRIAVQGLPRPGRSFWSIGWGDDAIRALERELRGSALLNRLQLVIPGGDTNGASFSPDGRQFLSTNLKQVRFWDANTGRLNKSFQGYVDGVNAPGSISPDGKRVLISRFSAGTGTVSVRVVDIETGLEKAVLSESNFGSAAIFSPDGNKVATVNRHGIRTPLSG
jgi:hypothetical protein